MNKCKHNEQYDCLPSMRSCDLCINNPQNGVEELRSQLAAMTQERDAAIEKAVEEEQIRWQDRLDFVHQKYDIDGSGCDSGDPLDLTCTEMHGLAVLYENEKYDHEHTREERDTLRGQLGQAVHCLTECKAVLENELAICELNGRSGGVIPDMLTGCVSGGGIQEILENPTAQVAAEEWRAMQNAIANIHMHAKRALAARPSTTTRAVQVGHIIRICEEEGITSSMLRDTTAEGQALDALKAGG